MLGNLVYDKKRDLVFADVDVNSVRKLLPSLKSMTPTLVNRYVFCKEKAIYIYDVYVDHVYIDMYRSYMYILQNTEAVAQRCSMKHVFLKILQNSQIHRKTPVPESFNNCLKLQLPLVSSSLNSPFNKQID